MKIKITGPVHHDGKALSVGDVVNLAESVANALVAAGAAELEGKQKAATVPAAPTSNQTSPTGQSDDEQGDGAGPAILDQGEQQ